MGEMKKFIIKLLNRFDINITRWKSIPASIRFMDYLLYFNNLYKKVSNFDGHVVECGVGKGRSFLILSYLASKEGKDRKIIGFDSFHGFPEPSEEDKSIRNPKKGEWSGTSQKDIMKILYHSGINKDYINKNITLVEGYLEDTLLKYNFGPIALLHVDVDLYQSYKTVLECLFNKVVKGGLILFDEYDEVNWPGAKKAIDDFIKENNCNLNYIKDIHKYYMVKE